MSYKPTCYLELYHPCNAGNDPSCKWGTYRSKGKSHIFSLHDTENYWIIMAILDEGKTVIVNMFKCGNVQPNRPQCGDFAVVTVTG